MITKILDNKLFTSYIIVAYAIIVINMAKPYTIERLIWLGKENGALEYASNIGYVLAITISVILGVLAQKKEMFFVSILMIIMLMRECGLHKAFTGHSMLSFRFYKNPAPIYSKLICGFIFVNIVLFVLFGIYKYAYCWWQNRKTSWGYSVLLTIWCLFLALIIDKFIHRLIIKFTSSLQIYKMSICTEEAFELLIPFLVILALCQYYFLVHLPNKRQVSV